MNWETVTTWIERLKLIVGAISVLGPIVIVPAFHLIRSAWRKVAKLREDVARVLHILRIFANRERRLLDITRRLIWAIRFEEKRGTLSHETIQVLHQLQRETDDLRDTAFRASAMTAARAQGYEINQGEMDGNRLGLLERDE